MSKELMKPRYLVTNDYPNCPFHKDYILSLSFSELHKAWYYEWVEYDGKERMFESEFDEYPHLFRRLQWWEFRDEKEMPEYVKCIKTPDQKHFPGMVYKVDNWNAVFPTDQHGDAIIVDTNCYLPSTLEEYESFTKK